MRNSLTSSKKSSTESDSSTSQTVSPRYDRFKLITIGKQKTVILESNNNNASAKRTALIRLRNSLTNSKSSTESDSSTSQTVGPRYEKIKLFSVSKQKTVISEPTLPKNNNDCSVEEMNNCASAKRNAFKAKRANAVTTIDVHQLQFVVQEYEFDDDPHLIYDLNSFLEKHPFQDEEHNATFDEFIEELSNIDLNVN